MSALPLRKGPSTAKWWNGEINFASDFVSFESEVLEVRVEEL